VIVCGDLTDAYDPTLQKLQQDDLKKIFSEVDPSIPFICVCGNHDVGNTPSESSIARYRDEFGDDYFQWTVGPTTCRFRGIVMNSTLLHDSRGWPEGAARQEQWLDASLAQFTADHAAGLVHQGALFLHHPLWLYDLEEGEDLPGYDEFIKDPKVGPSSGVFRIPHSYFHIPLEKRKTLAQKLVQHGIMTIFSGHFHRNAGGKDARTGLEQVVTSAVGRQLGKERSGFRVVSVFPQKGGIRHEYFALDEMPGAAALQEGLQGWVNTLGPIRM